MSQVCDTAIESLAKAIAISGTAIPAVARQELETLYKNKNKSLDDLDQFIGQKKTELGL